MNENNELFCEVGASDAAALCNALGWSAADAMLEFAVSGRILDCAQCGDKYSRRRSRDNVCSPACRSVLTRSRMGTAQRERKRVRKRPASSYQQRMMKKIF